MNDQRLILRIALATELGAAILLRVGLFTPPAGVLLVTVTATLVFVSWPHEYPLYLLFAAVAIALTGGTGTLGVGLGLAGALTLEGLRQFGAQRAALGGSTGSAVAMPEHEHAPGGRQIRAPRRGEQGSDTNRAGELADRMRPSVCRRSGLLTHP